MPAIRDTAKFTVSAAKEAELEALASRNLRRAPAKVWRAASPGAQSRYVGDGGSVDGGVDPKLPNGVRVAYAADRANRIQTGRIRNVGGVLVLMPAPRPAEGETVEALTAKAQRALADYRAAVAALEGMARNG